MLNRESQAREAGEAGEAGEESVILTHVQMSNNMDEKYQKTGLI